ncbi:hypothetical protein COLO4_06621 [Corchorus olitorius]|uniref:Uncharacterized protein n=1 Tax=Corchorus olitorius TaxID=93759 RepID=A0A1R3KMF7_9ROSI|nr:hypothetical protein COLO4_06621 [Corchorus olitorius]
MAFGKRNSQANFSPVENLEDDDTMIPEYENYSNSDDDGIEDLEAFDTNTKPTGQTVRESNVTNQSNSTAKPLLDEVIMKGVPDVKNPGGAKLWECPALLGNHAEFERIRRKVEEAEKDGMSHSLKNSKLTDRGPKAKGLIADAFHNMDYHQVDKEIVTALCANGIAFNVLRNPQFCRMISVINNAPKGYKPPSFEKVRTFLLDDVKTSVKKELMPVKDTWYTGGVSIVSDVHSLGFALCPKFYDPSYLNTPAPGGMARKRPNEDKEVMSGVLKAFEKMSSCPQEAKVLHDDNVGEETFGHEDMQQEEDTLNARIGSDSGNKKRMSSSTSGSGTSSSQPRKRKQSNISTFMRQGSSSSKRI